MRQGSGMTKTELARMIDLSCVQAASTLDEIRQAVDLARAHGVYAVYSLPAHIPYLVELLGGDPVTRPAATVGFPDGGATTAGKVRETREQREMGCREFDMVNNIAWLKGGRDDRYRDDIRAVVEAAGGCPVKVILECHYLTDAEIVRACERCVEAGAAFVKTGTGWAPTGATPDNVKLMVQAVGGRCGVKAAGGVRDLDTLLALQRLGATRFGIGVRTARLVLESVSDTVCR
jgi:deoxyribose-phosphate aldolase